MGKSLGIDDLLLLYADQLRPRQLPSWPQHRARLKIAQAAFGVDFDSRGGDGAGSSSSSSRNEVRVAR